MIKLCLFIIRRAVSVILIVCHRNANDRKIITIIKSFRSQLVL